MQPFLAQSPPTFSTVMPSSPIAAIAHDNRPTTSHAMSPLSSDVDHPRHGSTSGGALDVRSPASLVAVLPSSLPDYHRAYMSGHPKRMTSITETDSAEGSPKQRSSEEQAVTARRLKPHNRSQVTLEKAASKPEGLTPIPDKTKKRPVKWQFGIRSRNAPTEAMLAIYRALLKMGADWEVPKPRRIGRHGSEGSVENDGSEHSDGEEQKSQRGSPHPEDDESKTSTNGPAGRSLSTESIGRGHERYGPWNDWSYVIPNDPWVIHARFLKKGMLPPGVIDPSSTHSSRVDLHDPNQRRRSSTVNSASSQAEVAGANGPGMAGQGVDCATPDESVYIYMTIQLYNLDKDFYQVDFKCAGYERLVKQVVKEMQKSQDLEDLPQNIEGVKKDSKVDDQEPVQERWVGAGRANEEKDVSSPFPFLEVASTLIVKLADEQ